MRFVIQRVKEAKVKVGDEVVGSIGKGLLVLIGLTHSDKYSDIEFTSNKLLNLRLWDDSKGVRWKECVKSLNLEILIVSQFTLYSFMKGNKPDFHYALEPEPALKMYDAFVETLKKNYVENKIQCGKFGEYMEVSLMNDGPITINWEYPEIKNNDTKEVSIEEIVGLKELANSGKNKNNSKNKNKNGKSKEINNTNSNNVNEANIVSIQNLNLDSNISNSENNTETKSDQIYINTTKQI